MIKKLKKVGASHYVLLSKDIMELTGISDYVEIAVEGDVVVMRKAEVPQMNGYAKDMVV